MYHVGARQAEPDRRVGRYLDTVRHEVVLLGNDSHGCAAIRLDRSSEIALGELSIEVQSQRLHDLDIRGWMQGAHGTGQYDDDQHEKEHCGHDDEPALLRPRDDLFRYD